MFGEIETLLGKIAISPVVISRSVPCRPAEQSGWQKAYFT
jgi:hypothetical protein